MITKYLAFHLCILTIIKLRPAPPSLNLFSWMFLPGSLDLWRQQRFRVQSQNNQKPLISWGFILFSGSNITGGKRCLTKLMSLSDSAAELLLVSVFTTVIQFHITGQWKCPQRIDSVPAAPSALSPSDKQVQNTFMYFKGKHMNNRSSSGWL